MLVPMSLVRFMRNVTCVLLLSGAAAMAQTPASEHLDFVHGLDEYQHINGMLPDYMERQAQALVQARKQSLDVGTPEALNRRRQFVREHILRAIGGLPDRTPLNAHTVGVLERDGYRIEKVIFESQPKFYVTANLYLPATGHGPYPAVLYPEGHELGGKSNETWQQMLATLARRGYVALTWDTLGQGERVQLYSADLHDSLLRSSTTEHTILGIQALLTGQAIARYTIWDGIRALDYLLSRPEVDPARVAVTGNSGGGTHSAYLGALDDRIKFVAPSCYITSWHWMLKTIGPQDAEQVFPGWLGDGLDYPDFIYAAASKPYLILSAIRDFFPIDGARETFREARRVKPDLQMFEADDGHGYTHPRRMAAYDWLSRQFRGVPDQRPEAVIEPESAETLFCTPTGQVLTSLGDETMFTLNRARADRLRDSRAHPHDIREAALARTGYKPQSSAVPVTPYGTIQRDGYRIDKLIYESEPGILIPSLLYIPNSGAAKKPAVIIASDEGKSAVGTAAGALAKAGTIVLAVDLRGMGETHIAPDRNDSEFYRYFGDFEDAMTAVLMNRTLAGMRAADITRGIDMLAARPDVDMNRISAIGRNSAAVPMLYTAVFDKRIKGVALEGMLLSYDAVVHDRMQRLVFEQVVPGALLDFDIPDLVNALAPRSVWISAPVTPTGAPVAPPEFAKTFSSAAKTSRALQLRPPRPADERAAAYYGELLGLAANRVQ